MDIKDLTPNEILEKIISDPLKRTTTYVILGKSGPTGKTWLYNELRYRHLNAIEISEQIHGLVQYNDDHNHYFEPMFGLTRVIVLNKLLERSVTK